MLASMKPLAVMVSCYFSEIHKLSLIPAITFDVWIAITFEALISGFHFED
jgi:hypothetical protein